MVVIFVSVEVILDDDFNIFQVLVEVVCIVVDVCCVIDLVEQVCLKGELFGVGLVLGLLQVDLVQWFGIVVGDEDDDVCVQGLIDECVVVKKVCDFVCVDVICDQLVVEGIVLDDILQGVCWLCKCS